MEYIVEEFSFKDSTGEYIDVVNDNDYMTIKIEHSEDNRKFVFNEAELDFMYKKMKELFKQHK